MSLPPPLSQANPYAAPLTAEPSARTPQTDSLEALVRSGSRFYVVPYNFSLVVVSFRRTMGSVATVSTGEWPMGDVFKATLISALFGWWGFPFGLIFTFLNLFYLWNGGKDVTRDILKASLGAQEAKRILTEAPKPEKPGSIWLVRLIILIPLSLIAFFLFSIFRPME